MWTNEELAPSDSDGAEQRVFEKIATEVFLDRTRKLSAMAPVPGELHAHALDAVDVANIFVAAMIERRTSTRATVAHMAHNTPSVLSADNLLDEIRGTSGGTVLSRNAFFLGQRLLEAAGDTGLDRVEAMSTILKAMNLIGPSTTTAK